MAQEFSKKFYKSNEWKIFRENYILEKTTEEGKIKCEECGKEITEPKERQLHHIHELTPLNIYDVNITMNADNILLLCQQCHNKKHNRYCKGAKPKKIEKGIYIVYGPPLSGKTTYVLENKGERDLVIDMDRLFEAVTLLDRYNKPDALKYNVLAIRNTLIDNIKTRYGNFESAWIVGGYADRYEREKLASDLGAELIFIEATKEECYEKLTSVEDKRKDEANDWILYINKWFDNFS